MATDTLPETGAARALQNSGLKVTRQRVAVMEGVAQHPHATADEILAAIRGQSITRQAVYLIVSDLVRVGLLRRLDVPGQPARYETDRHDNHHHALCSGCGLVIDVPCARGSAPCLEPRGDIGIAVTTADVLYRGLCTPCQTTL